MISPRYVREVPQRSRLEASKSKSCGKINFPPRLVCPKCGKQWALKRTGKEVKTKGFWGRHKTEYKCKNCGHKVLKNVYYGGG